VHPSPRAAGTQITLTPEQQQLVAEHTHIVPQIAKRLIKTLSLPRWLDLDEMVSCGFIGLCKAALAYDPSRGQFETFATYRIRGSIVDDYLRRQAPVMIPMQDNTRLEHAESDDLHTEPIDPTPSIEDTLIAE
jgi:RNA polymerase sigma factor (sigma-70 family)